MNRTRGPTQQRHPTRRSKRCASTEARSETELRRRASSASEPPTRGKARASPWPKASSTYDSGHQESVGEAHRADREKEQEPGAGRVLVAAQLPGEYDRDAVEGEKTQHRRDVQIHDPAVGQPGARL